ncbi:MAG: glycosyltransferase [Eubacteriales bacterium]|nr:glycosyltransferase [Eubacteriales bacterium]
MRVALVTETFLPVVDGVGRVVVAYAETLAKMGHEVTVSAPLYNTGHRGGLPFELVDYTGFRVPTAPQYKTGSPILCDHYRRRMAMLDFDIVHAHSPFVAGREALRISRERGIPLVATFHSKFYDDFLKITKSETLANIVVSNIVSFFERCDEVWAVSASSGEVLRGYGYHGPMQVMTNGTTLRPGNPQALARARDRYQLGDVPVLLFVGQINWKKNILRILEAAALLRQSGTGFHLILVGQGSDEDKIRQKINDLGLDTVTILTGHVASTDDLDALYKAATLFVFPSLYDTFSLVVREAAAMGTPSVVVADSCAAEDIRDHYNGFLCADDSADLARVIQDALDDPEGTRLMGANAQASIPVTWDAVMRDVVSRYGELIVSHHPMRRSASRRRRENGKRLR